MKHHHARRVTIFKDDEGKFRFHVQAGNWKIIEASEQGFARKASVLVRVYNRWPGVELVDLTLN